MPKRCRGGGSVWVGKRTAWLVPAWIAVSAWSAPICGKSHSLSQTPFAKYTAPGFI